MTSNVFSGMLNRTLSIYACVVCFACEMLFHFAFLHFDIYVRFILDLQFFAFSYFVLYNWHSLLVRFHCCLL